MLGILAFFGHGGHVPALYLYIGFGPLWRPLSRNDRDVAAQFLRAYVVRLDFLTRTCNPTRVSSTMYTFITGYLTWSRALSMAEVRHSYITWSFYIVPI